MTQKDIRHVVARVLLGFAYISICFQWLWVLALGLPPLIEAGIFDSFTTSEVAPPTNSPINDPPSPLLTIGAGIVTIIFLIITVVVIIKLPKAVAQTGETIVHQTAEVIVPVITHHKKLPAKTKRALTQRLTNLLRSMLVLLPLVAALFLPAVESISRDIILIIALWMAIISSIFLLASWFIRPATSQIRSRESRG